MERTDERYDAYVQILHQELKPAMGCTEPIAVAYACAVARDTLGALPERVELQVSGNIIKNVKSVVVPNTGGRRGLEVAAAVGTVAADAKAQLQCIAHVTEQDMERVEEYRSQGRVTITPLETTHPFDILVEVSAGADSARVRMVDQHTNLVHVSRNGTVLHQAQVVEEVQENPLQQLLSVQGILDFADSVDLEDVRKPLEQQVKLNWAISQEGLEGSYGAMIGKELMAQAGDDWKARLRARAAAGSDARMSGCELPVVIISGSGNQGLTASLPVVEYAAIQGIPEERMYRALVVSNLLTVHQKTNLGRLSAFCGAVNAACAAAAAIAYLDGMGMDGVAHTLVNSLAVVSGMVCDGAKASCAAKISLALEAGLMGYEMYKAGHEFYDGDGIVKKGVENTLNMVARLGRLGMRETDREILRIMTGQ
ncbi:L-serine ammonia-lyase, iron-sulfur-dependent, subunit alpha [Pseudoflavonifractor sp. An85]|uniref:L-cysteine desulfidase family protein n=1 Tax=Pseudoflavonifractor sp. An85 TaxID=1965661 RepID=UPI000B38214D|nr:L-serine ammonia-lyase, iron-sulfur-dependent, subunit alpha [Pseudoflavonifractor sp. An85]OUN25436.1 hypothetical protein B5G37_04300 [Pseudoflavonifractor sp. An85]